MLWAAHHSGVVVVGFDGQTGHRAVDPLLLLTPVAEPNPNHLLLHGELLGDERDLLRVGLRVLKNKKNFILIIQAMINSNHALLACSRLDFSHKHNKNLNKPNPNHLYKYEIFKSYIVLSINM